MRTTLLASSLRCAAVLLCLFFSSAKLTASKEQPWPDLTMSHCAGAIAAAAVGTTILASSLRCAAVLLTFFFTSAKMTVFKEHLKAGAEDFKKGGQRDWRQARIAQLDASCVQWTESPLRARVHTQPCERQPAPCCCCC